jgi:hypothetical protein
MKYFAIISLLAIVVLGVSVAAFALDYNADLSLSLSEQYNDNIFLSHTDRVGDFITVINPALALSTKTDKIDAMLNYSPSLNYYASHDEKNDISHQASGQGLFRLTERLSVGLSDTFVQTKESSIINNTPSLQGAGPLAAGQNKITTNTLSGNLSYRFSEKLTFQPSVTYTTTDNTQTGVGDNNTYTGAMLATYLLTDRTSLKANASYSYYAYTVSSDAYGQVYTIGVTHKFTPTFTVDAYGGINVTTIKEPSNTDTGFTGGLTVTKTFEKGSASIALTDGIVPGLQGTSPLKSQVITLNYSRPLTAALDSSLSAWYGRYRSIGNIGLGQNSNYMGGNAGLSYKLTSWANLFLSYSYLNSDDNVNKSGSYHNQIITAGIKLSKQAKF